MSTRLTPKTYHFTLYLSIASDLTDELQGELLKAGCDDASLWSEGETVFLEFSREAESLGDAVESAIKDVERTGCAVTRLEVGATGLI
jgi:hypothetical protein